MRSFLTILIASGALVAHCELALAEHLELLSRSVVFLVATPTAQTSAFGTGFLITKGERPVLATAEHIARKLSPESLAVVQGATGEARSLPLRKLTGVDATIDWHIHPSADLAIVCLKPLPEVQPDLQKRFLPIEMLRADQSAPSRAYTLTVLGFPLALGTQGKFSPISRETKPASGLLQATRADTKKQALFFVTQDPSVGGFSGAPVLDTGLPYSSDDADVVSDGRPLQIVGVVHGTMSDDTGGKMGLVTPGHQLRELVAAECGS